MLVQWQGGDEPSYVGVVQLKEWCKEATGSQKAYRKLLKTM